MSVSPARIAALVMLAAPLAAQAPDTSALRVTFGGFVDGYYAYDFNRPPTLDRQYTTQAARHNEFNVNLAHVEANVSGDRVRGRLALQAGTSVQSNYAGEPTRGAVSGPSLSRHLQEAYAGVRVGRALWIDGGVFFSHMGMEGWISRDNPTYTRSLVAEFSPYYSSGVRATWQATDRLTARLDVVNGWQNVSETNQDKAAGLRLDYAPGRGAILSYYNFLHAETGGRLRTFNGAGAKVGLGARVQVLGQVDVGTQEGDEGADGASWWGFTAQARAAATARLAVVGRVERFDDRDQVLVATGVDAGFRANGLSLGVDWTPHARLMWRTEVKGIFGTDRVFVDRGDLETRDVVAVSALTLTF